MKDFLTRPYEDGRVKMQLIIFLIIKDEYQEAYELFLQIQQSFKKISDPLKYICLNLAAIFFADKLGKYQNSVQLANHLVGFYINHMPTRRSKLRYDTVYF